MVSIPDTDVDGDMDGGAPSDTGEDPSESCTLTIPPPPGDRVFDKQKVRVTYKSGDDETPLTYDPACLGENNRHYDDPAKPTQMVLCDSACESIQGDSHAALEVEFACVTTLIILKRVRTTTFVTNPVSVWLGTSRPADFILIR